jgi:dihydrofolate reductase
MDIVLVAAIAENGIIGRGNTLPWRLKSDMQHFRALTMGKPVVMGRKTFLSIGKPLAGRTTIVVSRDHAFAAFGNADAVIVAGGGEIYAQLLPQASQLAITHVHKKVDGDARFPKIDLTLWREAARSEHPPTAEDEAPFAFVTYARR